MTRLFNEPSRFADQLAEGFAVASSRWVRAVPGGVVRSTEIAPGTVVVVIGGGSGHYPAFGGLVGQGLAHGAAMGNVFASPSAQQVYSVAKAADVGGGILLAYCNYAGDVLNFDQAQERLRAEGIDCRTVVVTDDIYSAPADEIHRRRGIAGNLAVFKTAGAAAEAGYSLDEVVRVAASANARTRSFGVAFNGCTLPGASAPLFTVPKGRMAIGLGIHGEPGVGEQGIPTADGLAELLVSTLLAETPPKVDSASGSRAVVLLNSLGSVTFEELFVVYRRLGQLLESAGITVVEPEVGHLCTSFDMAGVSLTLFWVDDELERLWRAPADTPAFRKGSVVPAGRADASTAGVFASNNIALASPESRASVVVVVSALQSVVSAIDEQVEELGRIDAVAGDGDHGIGMQRGARAAFEAAHKAHELGAGVGTVLSCAADAWGRPGRPGASGALLGSLLSTPWPSGWVTVPRRTRVPSARELPTP